VLVMVSALAAPVALVAQSLIVYSATMSSGRGFLDQRSISRLPAFVRDLPSWVLALRLLASPLLQSRDELVALGKRLADPAKNMLVALGRAVGEGLLQILIALFVAFFFYRDGDRIRGLLQEAMARLAGRDYGAVLVRTAQAAVKGVVYGLLGTAFAQAGVALLGFPHRRGSGIDAARRADIHPVAGSDGPGPRLGGAAAWLYATDQTGWAIFMVIYGIAVISSVDNFLKPILMSRAATFRCCSWCSVCSAAPSPSASSACSWDPRSSPSPGASPLRGSTSPTRRPVKARVQLVEGMTFIAESGSGHAVVVDAAPDVGGRNLGARPMELVLMGTGACSAIDVVHILRKARQAITGCSVDLGSRSRRRRSEGLHPHPLPLRGDGKGLAEAQVERAIRPVEGEVLLGDSDAREDRRRSSGTTRFARLSLRPSRRCASSTAMLCASRA
jgi:uncharacterized OsmC-like protein